MTTDEPRTVMTSFEEDVRELAREYHEMGVPVWGLSVRLESIAEDMQREANEI